MTPDKKVEEYLERARVIEPTANIDVRVEIAKMIQLEEHRERLNPVGLLGSGEVYKLSRE